MLVVPVYLLILGAASAVAGLYGHRLLAALGLVPEFELGFIVTIGVACVFAAVQLAYVAFLRFFFPSRDTAPLLTEMGSLSAVALLAPIFLGLRVPGLPDISLPSAIGLFERADNLVFLACFFAVHLFFKLMTLFAATRTVPSSRLNSLFWIGACLATAFGAQWAFLEWRSVLFSPKTVQALELPARPVAAKQVYAEARVIPEGATVVFDISERGERDILFRFAVPDTGEAPQAAFATILIDGRPLAAAPHTLVFEDAPWVEIAVPNTKLSALARECSIQWNRGQEAAWLTQIGFHAPPASGSGLLLSGPHFHPPARSTSSFGIVLVALDGLGAADVRGPRAERSVTPELFAVSDRAIYYENAFAPAPESPASCMTLLTGLAPLRHGFMGGHSGPLPAGATTLAETLREQGYVTAAFTEGLPHGIGFERGFHLYDVTVPENGAADTLRAAGDFAEAHRGQRFFLFVRIAETSSLTIAPHRGDDFLPTNGTEISAVDIHDNALAHVDRLLGDFLDRLQTLGLPQRGCLVLAGSHGLELGAARPGFSLAPEQSRQLNESCLHVPLWVQAPGRRPQRQVGLISLERVAPLILEVAGVQGEFNGGTLGRYSSLLDAASDREVISVAGDPVALSLRTSRWRFTWQSGRNPFTGQYTGEASVKELLDVHRYAQGLRQANYYGTETQLAESFREQLERYLESHLAKPEITAPATH